MNSETVTTGTGQQFTFNSGTAVNSNDLLIYAPTDHDISSLINLGSGLEVLSAFTKTENVTNNGNQYDVYRLDDLVQGFNANYRATLN